MNYLEIFAIIALAGMIHASFQLSVSMLTLLSGHAIGSKTSQARLSRLTGGFVAGAIVMTTLIVSFLSYSASVLHGGAVSPLAWAIASGVSLGLGLGVWIFYYRKERGTSLWIPRGMARFLSERTKSTKHAAESFSLGLTSVVAELLFIVGPAAIASFALVSLPEDLQLLGIALYVFIASLPLLVVFVMVGSGHKLSRIQRWREDNKRFLQFAAGSALAVLGFYVYVNEVVVATVAVAGAL